jgi:hypothetical protein
MADCAFLAQYISMYFIHTLELIRSWKNMSRPIRQCRKTAGEVLSELHKIDEWDSDGGSGEDEPETDSVCDSDTI